MDLRNFPKSMKLHRNLPNRHNGTPMQPDEHPKCVVLMFLGPQPLLRFCSGQRLYRARTNHRASPASQPSQPVLTWPDFENFLGFSKFSEIHETPQKPPKPTQRHPDSLRSILKASIGSLLVCGAARPEDRSPADRALSTRGKT